MTNGDWVFDRAIHLMDEQNETNGKTKTQDTKEYEYRTLSILNVLRNELYPYSDTYTPQADGKKPFPAELASMDQPIDLDDGICQSILPYGLAAHLLLGENDTMAGFFQQRYEELLSALKMKTQCAWEDIPFSFM